MLLICTPILAASQATVQGPEGDCGFSKFQPHLISHFVERGVIAKVTPQYPPAAKAKGLSGTVRVRILINRQGFVERTCPVYVSGERKADRSLMIAAEAAALQWTFQPNFGLEPASGLRFDYAQDILQFEFVPEEPDKKDRSKK